MRKALVLLAVAALAPLWAQEEEAPPEAAVKPPVMLTFTPPDLEGSIVLGIFDEEGKLRRTLRFEPGTSELRIDTNGYIAQWDGRDNAGKSCPAGRYSARGYVVGEDVGVEGDAFYFNDWMAEDQIPAQEVHLRQWPGGVGVELKTPQGAIFKRIDPQGELASADAPVSWKAPQIMPPALAVTPVGGTSGRDGTTWFILDVDGQHVVVQFGKDNASERELRVPKDEPQPIEILASPSEDAILLKEAGAGGIQRVRMLRRAAAATQADGRVVSDWEVVFERTLEPCANFGVVDGKLVADAGLPPQADEITVQLMENALEPGKKPALRLKAASADPGSFLQSPEKLPLVEVSTQGKWDRFAMVSSGSDAMIYQGDGIVVEAFSLKRLDHIAAFDAGSFLMGAPAP